MVSRSFGDDCREHFDYLCEKRSSLVGTPGTHRERASILHDIDSLLDRYLAWEELGRP